MASSPRFAKIGPAVIPRVDLLIHKVTRGRFTMSQGMIPIVILTTTGAKSGQPRIVPLATIPIGDVHYVVASNFGREHHPAWSANLIAHPDATAEINGRSFLVRAELLDEADKEKTWPELTALWPPYDEYVERSGREIRVFRLTAI